MDRSSKRTCRRIPYVNSKPSLLQLADPPGLRLWWHLREHRVALLRKIQAETGLRLVGPDGMPVTDVIVPEGIEAVRCHLKENHAQEYAALQREVWRASEARGLWNYLYGSHRDLLDDAEPHVDEPLVLCASSVEPGSPAALERLWDFIVKTQPELYATFHGEHEAASARSSERIRASMAEIGSCFAPLIAETLPELQEHSVRVELCLPDETRLEVQLPAVPRSGELVEIPGRAPLRVHEVRWVVDIDQSRASAVATLVDAE